MKIYKKSNFFCGLKSEKSALTVHSVLNNEQILIQIKNGLICGKNLFLDSDHYVDVLPTMYKSWTKKQEMHLGIKKNFFAKNPFSPINKHRDLLIFDTWGVSSYYHLLIDHIIPVWITKEWARENLNLFDITPYFWRISKNDWENELPSTNEIFKFFLGSSFEHEVKGRFLNIIYGYFYGFRPWNGERINTDPTYKEYLNRFRLSFCNFSIPKVNYVLVPTRETRSFSFVNYFINKYSEKIQFKVLDMSQFTVAEQIALAGEASVLFGSEGAAFANQVFMNKGSMVVPVSNDNSRFQWHSSLAQILEHDFLGVELDKYGYPLISEKTILEKLSAHHPAVFK